MPWVTILLIALWIPGSLLLVVFGKLHGPTVFSMTFGGGLLLLAIGLAIDIRRTK